MFCAARSHVFLFNRCLAGLRSPANDVWRTEMSPVVRLDALGVTKLSDMSMSWGRISFPAAEVEGGPSCGGGGPPCIDQTWRPKPNVNNI